MRYYYLLLLSALLSTTSTGQNWFGPGATWHYEYTNLAVSGYTRLQYTGEANQGGQDCIELSALQDVWRYITNQQSQYELPSLFVQEENNVVLLYKSEQWDTIFNFNAEIGEGWTIKDEEISTPAAVLQVTVEDKNVVTLDGQELASMALLYQFTAGSFGNDVFEVRDTVVERIGTFRFYLDPFDYLRNMLDFHEAGHLRCFEDEEVMFNDFLDMACDALPVNVREAWAAGIRLYPNPTLDVLYVDNQSTEHITSACLYSPAGQLVRELDVQQTAFSLRDLTAGLYYLELQTEVGYLVDRVVLH